MNLERFLYLCSRTMGDYRAAKRGTLARRLTRRASHRTIIRVLRGWGLW